MFTTGFIAIAISGMVAVLVMSAIVADGVEEGELPYWM